MWNVYAEEPQPQMQPQQGTYVAAQVEEGDAEKLKKAVQSDLIKAGELNSFIPTEKELHITIMYSMGQFIPVSTRMLSNTFATIKGYGLLDSSDNPMMKTLVFLVESSYLNKKRGEVESLGLADAYPQFIPHISMGTVPANFVISDIDCSLNRYMVKLDREICNPLQQ